MLVNQINAVCSARIHAWSLSLFHKQKINCMASGAATCFDQELCLHKQPNGQKRLLF
jgi:hypothetical protein